MFKARELESSLKKEIIGQDEAVAVVVRNVVVAEMGICDPQRPLTSALFIGPTGVGKSQIGRSLAKILHGDDRIVIAINCTEFKNPHDVAKLVGAPPGYVGHDQPPFLTQEKLAGRMTIVIFEELEKADRALHDLLLQILERGELKTGRGVDLSFTNCFLFMTSNIGTHEADRARRGGIGFARPIIPEEVTDIRTREAQERAIYKGAVENFFNPEFVSRLDEMVVFRRLKEEHMLSILEKFLLDTRARLSMAGLGSAVTDRAKRFLVEKGTNIRYGARPLRRAVREYLEFPLANAVSSQPNLSNMVVTIDCEEESNRLSFSFSSLVLFMNGRVA